MKAKTIKKVLKQKITDWLASIEDEKVRELAAKNTIVTGGCIASMLLKEKVNDYDLYFRNKETVKELAKYYIKRFKIKSRKGIPCDLHVQEDDGRIRVVVKSSGIASENGAKKPYKYFEGQAEGEAGEYINEVINDPGEIEDTYEETKELARDAEDKPPYRPVFVSTNAIMLSGKIQIVLRFYGEPSDIHENYDFVHCTNYYTYKENSLVLHQQALECLLSKELLYQGSLYPVCSLFRLRKFINRGWSITAGQILKACMQISALDLTDIDVLRDQLTGVDCAYFIEVIGMLEEKNPQRVNSTYLCELIDRMF